jgi:hypothetical protein
MGLLIGIHALLAIVLSQGPAAPVGPPGVAPTRPETTSYQETSRYAEVVEYMRAMAAEAPQIHLTTYGYTVEGRALPLAVVGAPNATPPAVLATGKTRILVQGNIHAGEVEGKEAALWLLRSVARGERKDWEKDVVLLIAPIYNADGNERVNVGNRGAQHGPVGGMGQRHNAQDLDLNRDATKLETAEARSLARLLQQYDPHMVIDMHATNGSDHGYYLTYDLPGNPNCSAGVLNLLRHDLFPAVTKSVKSKHGWDYFYYGGPVNRPERAWAGDAELYKPRYTHTYVGLRNRLGILSEAYAYATFEDRIKATYRFVEEIVNYAVKHGAAIQRATAEADAESIVGTQQAVRATLTKCSDGVDIVLADVVSEPNPYVPDQPMRRRVNGSERVERMPHYGLIQGTETSVAPRAFILLADGSDGARVAMARVMDRLQAHGVKHFTTASPRVVSGERFRIQTSTLDERESRGGGHKLRTLTGAWEPVELQVPAGSLVIRLDQPLARLAFVLLDPRSDDGFMAWNLLDSVLAASPPPAMYPLVRTMADVQP